MFKKTGKENFGDVSDRYKIFSVVVVTFFIISSYVKISMESFNIHPLPPSSSEDALKGLVYLLFSPIHVVDGFVKSFVFPQSIFLVLGFMIGAMFLSMATSKILMLSEEFEAEVWSVILVSSMCGGALTGADGALIGMVFGSIYSFFAFV